MNLQFFNDGDGVSTGTEPPASGMQQLDTMLSQMSQQQTTQTPQPPDTSGQQAAQQTEQTTATEQHQQTPEDKSNFAFGQMRVKISTLEGLLGKVAKASGIEYTDANDLLTKLNDDAINKLAQRQNVPVELLRRMEELEQNSNAYKQQQIQNAAAVGFQTIMTDYSLTQEELKAFALELDKVGKNPFAQPIDIVAEYKLMHYDDIINKRVEAAVQAALTKSNVADQNSSTPNTQQGQGGGADNKITTISGLNALLDTMPK